MHKGLGSTPAGWINSGNKLAFSYILLRIFIQLWLPVSCFKQMLRSGESWSLCCLVHSADCRFFWGGSWHRGDHSETIFRAFPKWNVFHLKTFGQALGEKNFDVIFRESDSWAVPEFQQFCPYSSSRWFQGGSCCGFSCNSLIFRIKLFS